MIFTSGAYNGESTTGYLRNAEIMNPLFTSLINDANAAGNYGPIGVVFSDWVLTDSHKYGTTTYNVQGVNIVPAIIENNFHYAADFVLDDELFADGAEDAYDVFEGKEYFMRNIGTGKLLSCGGRYGTHATCADYGIRITPSWVSNDNTYVLKTTFAQWGNPGCLGSDAYIDNTGLHYFSIKYAGQENTFYFTFEDGGSTKALTATPNSGWVDGTSILISTMVIQCRSGK